MHQMWQFVVELGRDEHGQDLVEYAMLGAFVALATLAGLHAIEDSVSSAYVAWDQDEQDLWIVDDPPAPPPPEP
jgi:Flp pilus assembly pilin Flp